jgi:hypothetical protein
LQSFYDNEPQTWRALEPDSTLTDPAQKKQSEDNAKAAKKSAHDFLLSSLQLQHLVVLAGSGTSLGPVGGPSMWNLWDHCVNSNPDTGKTIRTKKPAATKTITDVAYDEKREGANIEALLSQCEAFLQLKPGDADVQKFVNDSKQIILTKCSEFIDATKPNQLDAHRTFLHRMSRRRVRDSRLKLFTTNYDICFEKAAGRLGLVVIDGFSFSQPRYFDPRFFSYDIVRRSSSSDEATSPLPGVFQLYKLHGSVNWEREGSDIVIAAKPDPKKACIIYPARGKYQQTYIQPHLELVSQFFAALREPNSCLVTIGFGYNDDHLSEPILAAVKSNPHLRLIIVSPSAEKDVTDKNMSRYWAELFALGKEGSDVRFFSVDFAVFANLIPDLKSLTPAEQLARNIQKLAGTP